MNEEVYGGRSRMEPELEQHRPSRQTRQGSDALLSINSTKGGTPPIAAEHRRA